MAVSSHTQDSASSSEDEPDHIEEEKQGADESDEDTESIHNDGKGIQVSASLIGLLPPPKSGEKRRANAKPPVTTKVVYVHEKTEFLHGLVQIIGYGLKRSDLCKGDLDRNGNLDAKASALFSLEYTIPRTQLKDVELLSRDDWATFLEEAGKKPSAQGKLVIREKVTPEAEAAANIPGDDELGGEENENEQKKKKKKHVPTEEEINQDTIIKHLTEIHMCEDRKCTFIGPCWVDAESTTHIHLTHLHLRTWAAAIDAGRDGVDHQHPLNAKLFDSTAANASADIATMAKRRATAASLPAAPSSNVYLSLDGLAELFRTWCDQSCAIITVTVVNVYCNNALQ